MHGSQGTRDATTMVNTHQHSATRRNTSNVALRPGTWQGLQISRLRIREDRYRLTLGGISVPVLRWASPRGAETSEKADQWLQRLQRRVVMGPRVLEGEVVAPESSGERGGTCRDASRGFSGWLLTQEVPGIWGGSIGKPDGRAHVQPYRMRCQVPCTRTWLGTESIQIVWRRREGRWARRAQSRDGEQAWAGQGRAGQGTDGTIAIYPSLS